MGRPSRQASGAAVDWGSHHRDDFPDRRGVHSHSSHRFASAYSYRADVYENETLATITAALRSIEGGFVDAGANVGYFSIAAAKLAPERPVWAFEADPVIYRYLLCNLQQNGASGVVGLQMALADREGTSFFKSHRHGSEGSLVEANSGSTGDDRSTPVTALRSTVTSSSSVGRESLW